MQEQFHIHLNANVLHWIKGFRNKTEIDFTIKDIISISKSSSSQVQFIFEMTQMQYVLIMYYLHQKDSSILDDKLYFQDFIINQWFKHIKMIFIDLEEVLCID